MLKHDTAFPRDAEFLEYIRSFVDESRLSRAAADRLIALARRGAAVQAAEDDQFMRIQRLDRENCVLRAAMMKVTEAFNQGRIVPRAGVSGMTIDAQLRNSVYTGVPCGPIEDAIMMLDEAGLRLIPLPPPPAGETND